MEPTRRPCSWQCKRTLGFVQRNIKTKIPKVREKAYNTLVRPQLEYASAVWDPHTTDRTGPAESCSLDREASATQILQELGWRTLEQRRANARLYLFYKLFMV